MNNTTLSSIASLTQTKGKAYSTNFQTNVELRELYSQCKALEPRKKAWWLFANEDLTSNAKLLSRGSSEVHAPTAAAPATSVPPPAPLAAVHDSLNQRMNVEPRLHRDLRPLARTGASDTCEAGGSRGVERLTFLAASLKCPAHSWGQGFDLRAREVIVSRWPLRQATWPCLPLGSGTFPWSRTLWL